MRILLAVLWCCVTLCEVAFGQSQELKEKIDRQVAPVFEAESVVGLVVGIVQDGKSHVLAYGETEKGSGQLPTGETIYEIGSISKVFTGVLLADMVERGEVALNDPVQQYLPKGVEMPVLEEQPIRLIHLATHTSGLPRLPSNLSPADPLDPYADYTEKLLYEFLNQLTLTKVPGEGEYSNFGMGLLGHVLALKSESSYEDLLKSRICKPLGLHNTTIALSTQQRNRLAPAYNGVLQPVKNWSLGSLQGAGAIRSSCRDMLQFAEAQFSVQLSPIINALTKSREIHHRGESGIDLGLAWHRARDQITWWHNGQTGGYSSYLAVIPSKKMGVVILANTSFKDTTQLGEKIVQVLYGMEVAPIEFRKPVAVDEKVLNEYVGKYWISPFFSLNVTVEEGQLMVQATNQPKLPVYAEAESKFFYRVVDAQLSFIRDEEGQVSKLTLHQGGQNMNGFRRVESAK